jgi:hypothetical protein
MEEKIKVKKKKERNLLEITVKAPEFQYDHAHMASILLVII